MSTVPAAVAPASLGAYLALIKSWARDVFNFVAGLAILFAIWWAGIGFIASKPAMSQFADFGPIPTFHAVARLWGQGVIQSAVQASGYRLGLGMLIAIAIGVPIGIFMGQSRTFRELSNSPSQLLRMISPLSWEPIAVIVFAGWDKAIIFLIAMGAVWPVMFATAAGLAKVDPNWFKVARNLGARPRHILLNIIVPAIAYDVLTGIRLAVGVAWIVLVPAEFFGVTSGLGYTIEDARETLSYDNLMAMILVIGAIGYVLDTACVKLIKCYCWQRET